MKKINCFISLLFLVSLMGCDKTSEIKLKYRKFQYDNNVVSCEINGVRTESVPYYNEGLLNKVSPAIDVLSLSMIFDFVPEIFVQGNLEVCVNFLSYLDVDKLYSVERDEVSVVFKNEKLPLSDELVWKFGFDKYRGTARCEKLELVSGHVEFSRLKKGGYSKKDYAEGTFEFTFKMTVSGYPRVPDEWEHPVERVSIEVEEPVKFENGKFKLY